MRGIGVYQLPDGTTLIEHRMSADLARLNTTRHRTAEFAAGSQLTLENLIEHTARNDAQDRFQAERWAEDRKNWVTRTVPGDPSD